MVLVAGRKSGVPRHDATRSESELSPNTPVTVKHPASISGMKHGPIFFSLPIAFRNLLTDLTITLC
jgi:hypothetical protein